MRTSEDHQLTLHLTAAQVRAARAALRMEQSTLAERAGVSLPTIKRLEQMEGRLKAQPVTVIKIRQALEMSGIVFTNNAEGEAPGLLLNRDKTVAYRSAVADLVRSLTEAILKSEARKEASIFRPGVDHIAVATVLVNQLPKLIAMTIADVPLPDFAPLPDFRDDQTIDE